MDIINNGVELDAEEFIQFFSDHHEEDSMIYYDGDRHVSTITAVTGDDRLVLAMTAAELYSAQYKVLTVTVANDGNYIVKIVR